MNPLADHLWQSTVFAGVVGLLALTLRNNRAKVRHWLWLAASVKFLVPLSMLIALGSQMEWRPAQETAPPTIYIMLDQVSQPFTAPAAALPVSRPHPDKAPKILFAVWAVWLCGFLGIAGSSLIRWRRIRAAVRASRPLHLETPIRAVAAPILLEPGIFGIFRPVLLLPEGILERLTPEQLKAVIAHELCHVRHRDNLTAAIHMLVETVFWFHPLVWWIGKRMVAERERACDEEVVRLLGEPKAYAEGILNVCKLYAESPLTCFSGVTGGSNLKKRIEAIMTNSVTLRLNFAKKATLAIAGMAALAMPIVVGIVNAQAPVPKFEVASIRACEAPGPGASKGPGAGPTPGRINACRNLSEFIRSAYVEFEHAERTPPARIPIEGGPAWTRSDRYRINAKAEGEPRQEMMEGPMLQALLEDRFKLRIHRETREVPVYELTVTKGGLKMQPSKEGSCISLDPQNPPQQRLPPPEQRRICGGPLIFGPTKGQTPTIAYNGVGIDTVANGLGNLLGRPVIDKTGISGRFDVSLEFVLDESTPGLTLRLPPSDEPAGPSIFTAVQQQLGLKLDSARGPGEFLVIDSVERPSEN